MNHKEKPEILPKYDFNCDLTEKSELLNYVSSVNISSGFDKKNPLEIKSLLLQAKKKNIIIGGNIGFTGKKNLKEDEIEALVIYQVGSILSFAKALNIDIEHIRPCGDLYIKASEDYNVSKAIAMGIKKCSQWLNYVGLFGENIQKVGDDVKICIAQELLPEKIYTPQGFIDKSKNDIEDITFLMTRLQNLVKNSKIYTNSGESLDIKIDTIHFQNKDFSLEFIKRAKQIIEPVSINCKKAILSGWV